MSSGLSFCLAFTAVLNSRPSRPSPSSLISALKNPHGILTTAGKDGCCVRDMMKQSGADIKSWTDKNPTQAKDGTCRPTRTFVVEVGSRHSVAIWVWGLSKVDFSRLLKVHPQCHLVACSYTCLLPDWACCQSGLAARVGLFLGGRSSSSALVARLSGHSAHEHQITQCLPRPTGCDPLLRCAPSCRARRKTW